MSEYVDILSIIILGLLCGSKLIKNLRFKTKFLSVKALQLLFTGSFFSIFVLGVLLVSNNLTLLEFERFLKVNLIAQASLFFTLLCYLRIDILSLKKIKTLWRVPLIGCLLGVYFEWQYIPFVYSFFYILGFLIFWNEREKFRYLLKKIPFLVLVSFGGFLFSLDQLVLLNIMLILQMLLSEKFCDMVQVSSLSKIFEEKRN